MAWLLVLVPLSMLGLLFVAIVGAGPIQYDPPTPDDELGMLMRGGMTREEAVAFQDDLQTWLDRAR